MQELGFGSLWLQVLLAGVATFVASAIIWMLMPWHRRDFEGLPDEDAVRQALLAQGVTGGQWRIPHAASMDACKSPEFQERMTTGPVGILQLEKPGPMSMGPRLAKSFLFSLAVAFFTAYVLRQAVESGDTYMRVFQLAGSVSFGAYAFGVVPEAIWFSYSWRRVLLNALDALIYAVLTAGIFASMWPWA